MWTDSIPHRAWFIQSTHNTTRIDAYRNNFKMLQLTKTRFVHPYHKGMKPKEGYPSHTSTIQTQHDNCLIFNNNGNYIATITVERLTWL